MRTQFVWRLTPKRNIIMQVSERVKVEQNALVNEIYAPSIAEKSDKVKGQEAKLLVVNRSKHLSRFLEASCDCV